MNPRNFSNFHKSIFVGSMAFLIVASYLFSQGNGVDTTSAVDSAGLNVVNLAAEKNVEKSAEKSAEKNSDFAVTIVEKIAKEDRCLVDPAHVTCRDQKTMPATVIASKNTATVKTNTWNVGGAKAQIPSIPLNERIRDYDVVEIEQHPESIPDVGDQVTLPMLKGQHVVVDVKSISISANGDKTWSGHLQGGGTDYPVIMTYGETSIFAMITTPEGSYSMESVRGVGWLYKNPSELELSSTENNDYLEVPEIL